MQQEQHLDFGAQPDAAAVTFEPADERTRAEMAALADEELLVVNLDVMAIVSQILGALPDLREVEALVLRRWQHPPVGQMDRLGRYLGALLEAHGLCGMLKPELPDVAAMARELAGVRQQLWSSSRPLVLAGVLAGDLFEPYRQAKGHRALVRSVCGIVAVFRAGWARIAGRTHVSAAMLDRAEAQAEAFSLVLKNRHRAPDELARALRARRQAFTLLLREYSELRRAAQFLYGTREADRRVPSLFRKRPRAPRGEGALLATGSA